MRDDFPDPAKKHLAGRAGHQCANPDCKASTSGPQADEQKSFSIGVAAHIVAASKGGPRFDPSLSAEQRASIVNGIWLCQNCARMIDADETRYSVALLYHWKIAAEKEAHQSVGRSRLVVADGAQGTAIPVETIRIVPKRRECLWSTGTDELKRPVRSIRFFGTITEVSNKHVRIPAAELQAAGSEVEHIIFSNNHNGQRPQFLRPHETAEISVYFTVPLRDDLGPEGEWVSTVVIIDHFGNHYELKDCVFRKHPME